MNWHVAQANAGLILQVMRGLKREGFCDEDEGRRAFNPAGRLLRSRFGRREQDAMPGYVFLRFDLDDPGFVWQKARRIEGLTRLLPGEGYPGILPFGFVEEMEGRVLAGEFDQKTQAQLIEEMAAKYSKGDDIYINSGPFASFSGKLDHRKKGTLMVLVSLFGRENMVAILPHQASPCAPEGV